jgi:polar amino acid transport system substrate-binding protein
MAFMKKFLAMLTAVMMLCVLCVPAFAEAADESLKKVQEKGELILGLDENFPPMGFKDADGNIVGFDIDVAAAVCEKLGVTLKCQPIDWSAKELELSSGAVDCLWNGMTITEDRKAAMEMSTPYCANAQVVCVKADSEIKTLADLSGKVVGLQAGSSAVEALNKAEELKASLAEAAEFDDYMVALMDLDAGNVDAVLIDEVVANYYITAKQADYRLLEEKLADEEYGIGFRKGDVALRDAVNEALIALYQDGSLNPILEKWFGNTETILATAGETVSE